jgi:hypothetical protein
VSAGLRQTPPQPSHGLKTKHYYTPASKALPAVVLGIVARVGSVNGQRVALITELIRADSDAPSETALRTRVVRQVAKTLSADEMPVFDVGFKVRELQAAQLTRYLIRLAAKLHFPKSYPLPERLRKKASVFDHLPKGILGHRRTTPATST